MRYFVAVCLAVICCLVPVSAVDGDTSAPPGDAISSPVDTPDEISYPASDVDTEEELVVPDDGELEPDPSEPQTVIVLDPSEIAEYPFIAAAASANEVVIGDDSPTTSPFYGSGWVTGSDSNLGIITLYFPRNYCSDTWGVDSNGYLINVTSSSVGGYYSGAYNNSVSAPSFAYPRYRSSNNYDYTDIHLIPLNSNMDIYTSHRPRKTMEDLLPYVTILLIGGVLVCFMRRSSS